MDWKLKETETEKIISSKNLNMVFNKKTGFTAVWGETLDDDPEYSPIGPFIADIEVTTSCLGSDGILCKMCYKSNNPNGKNMSLDTFKQVFSKLPKTITQIAFGADSQATANPDLFKIMNYCRENGVIPNITVADISEDTAKNLAETCGAVAVSHYNTNTCKRSIEYLTKHGLKQINVHQVLSVETLDNCYAIIDEYKNIPNLNAIVFLSLKQKGRGRNFTPLSYELFKDLIDYAFKNNTPIGFDSCTAHKFLKYIRESEDPSKQKLAVYIEPCESMLFSTYIDVDAKVFPCSFSPDNDKWKDGIDILSSTDYIKDVWDHPRMLEWRETLLNNKRACPLYNI